ncbi:MAG TPA: UdgX family uracil-DNA binding protein [Solirubrobacterales bacterium]|nr:UdgX family uracil-DNA binding protein [Solirubrobacterales bacterium]
MADVSSAAEFLPEKLTLEALASAAEGCRGCPLYKDATQVVFGRGRSSARLMLVGEQPGDKEDKEGEPFVGPAGRLLDKALGEAGIDRSEAYVTNAVKHFKWRPRGNRRLHQTPRAGEIEACKPWLEAEVEAVEPEAVLAMGATAARSLFGPKVKVTKDRGRPLESPLAPVVAVTIHPSAILRLRDHDEREAELAGFVADLEGVAAALEGTAG